MKVLEDRPDRLHIEFREECTFQLFLGVILGIASLLSVMLFLFDFSASSIVYLLFTVGIATYAFIEKTPYGCLIDRSTGQLMIFQRNMLGQTQIITCQIKDIRTITVKRRVSGKGRPCSASVNLKSGQQLSLMSYQPCAAQRQVVDRLVSVLPL